ncbi:MAG: glycosyltransferase [Saprospiraceae bacterium]|nr:glycosyltransferase [Saprospiraceae bacterium]
MWICLFTAFAVCLALAYAGLQLCYWRAWRRLPVWAVPGGWAPRTLVTVLVPARNESGHIAACLHAILSAHYPAELLEVLVLDDFSEDDTARQAAAIPGVCVLRLADYPEAAPGGKKRALELGIAQARGTLIAATDADSRVPPDWLRLSVSLYEQRRLGAIVGPVAIAPERGGLLSGFQALDLAGMVGITGAGLGLGWHRMGNGANLCYPKVQFEAVGGYTGNRHLASGDDLFLLQKIARRAPVVFLKNAGATVRTPAQTTWLAFARQRLRWGSKAPALPEWSTRLSLALVFVLSCSVLYTAGLAFFYPKIWPVLLLQVALKGLSDYILLAEMCRFFQRRDLLRWFFPALVLHPLYIAGIGAWSLFAGPYHWKGRRLA